jgi:hypothetical protein
LPYWRWRRGDIARGKGLSVISGLAAFAVETFLVPFALSRSIVLPAPLIGELATMVLPAAELAAEILPARVAGMSEKANPAVAAAYRAVLQIRTIAQDGIQRELILTDKPMSAVGLVPILAKSKNFRDSYNKIAKFSVKMLIVLGMSSSYSLDAKTSRGRARIFLYLSNEDSATDSRNRSTRHHSANHLLLLSSTNFATFPQYATWKEKTEAMTAALKTPHTSSFPSSGSI